MYSIYNLTFLVTLPIFLISLGIVIYAMTLAARNIRGSKGVASVGLAVWLVGIIAGSLVFLFA